MLLYQRECNKLDSTIKSVEIQNNLTRIPWVDVLKALGIFAIYLGHFGKFSGSLYSFVFSYHVPLFFFISGFFVKIKKNETYLQFVWNKFKTLMIPYFIFSVLYVLFDTLQNNLGAHQSIHEMQYYIFAIRNTLSSPQLWFFSCLFIIEILYQLAIMLIKNKYIVFLIALVFACIINVGKPSWFWNIDSALVYLVYYSIGHVSFNWLNKYRYRQFKTKGKVLYVIIVFICLLFTAMTYFKGYGYILNRFNIQLPTQIYSFYSTFCTCILIFTNIQLAFILEKSTFLQSVGKETLVLCGTESFAKGILSSALFMFGIQLNLSSPIITVIYTAICLIFSYFIFAPIYHKYFSNLFGNNKKSYKDTLIEPDKQNG
jgi:fucose 4-O-acetylase-like acetyltransferase